VHPVIIRDARPGERAVVGELRVAAYQALGLLPDGSGYVETLRGFGFDGDCAVLVAAGETGNDILGTVTLEPFDPASELAMDDTEADIRTEAAAGGHRACGEAGAAATAAVHATGHAGRAAPLHRDRVR
jgi:hypothetical protein